VIPGQVLTFGGALTSRLEWYSRRAGIRPFDKAGAHQVVAATTRHLLTEIPPRGRGETLYEQMCDYAGFENRE
jgi:hypothetical protein